MSESLRALLLLVDAAHSIAEPLLEPSVIRGFVRVASGPADPRVFEGATEADIVLLELRSPRPWDKIEALCRAAPVPVIVLSPWFESSEEERLLEAGADDVLSLDGLDPAGLLVALRRAMARRRGRTVQARSIGGAATTQEVTVRPGGRLWSDAARRERELRQTQKMEAVGTLAAGIAHDMNNVLGSILGLASVLSDDFTPEDHRRSDIEAIAEACKRGRTLVRNLMGFARKGKFQRCAVSVGDLLEELAAAVRRRRLNDIRIEFQVDPQLPPVQGDPDQLRHMLRNLVENSLEAMNNGGILGLETRLVQLDELDVSLYRDLRPGEFVLVEITDTGVGMDAEMLDRVFEPFFTTKPRTENKGLGLSMAYGAVRHHGGVIQIASQPGSGSRVSVYLPASRDEGRRSVLPSSDRLSTPMPRDPAAIGRGRTALLVDDEELMRISGKRMLERFGFEVHTANHGAAAVEFVSADPTRYSIVLLDMIMPVLSGEQAFEQLRATCPSLPILLCSGFAKESHTDDLLSRGNAAFLLKPFGLDALEKALLSFWS